MRKLIVASLLVGALAFTLVKCGHDDVTIPDMVDTAKTAATPAPVAVTPTVVPTPTPPPTSEAASWTFNVSQSEVVVGFVLANAVGVGHVTWNGPGEANYHNAAFASQTERFNTGDVKHFATPAKLCNGTYQVDWNSGGSDVKYRFFTYTGRPCTEPTPPPRPTCDVIPDPTFFGALALANETKTTEDVTKGTIFPVGVLSPTLPQTVARPNYGDPDLVYSVIDTVNKAEGGKYGDRVCLVSHTYTITIPAQLKPPPSCKDYEDPTFTGALALANETATTEDVTAGSISPVGTLSPTLPQTVARPASDEDPKTYSVTDTVDKAPGDLYCPVEHVYSISIPPQEPPPPEHGHCYYNVPGHDGKRECQAQPGFISWNEHNHLCELAFPGVAQDGFNLNPGQSDPGCLSKHDD